MNAIPPEKRQRAIDVIERNAVAQHQLVEDLLDMSRITTGKVRLDPAPMPVVTVLREAVEGVKPAADAKGIALELDFDPFAGTVLADATRLQQVFWNLLSNAVKFTTAGGRIAASLRRAGADVEIVISDNGMGISPDFLPFVFEPFRQADTRVERGIGGLGLGLAISRQLVELHGGTIRAASLGAGHGATFTVRLPRVGGHEPELSDENGARPRADVRVGGRSSLAGVRILLVDDEEDTLTMFREAFEEAGAEVRAVANGLDAVRAAAEHQPDLLVTDLVLPEMDGYELLRALRADESHRTLPAIAVSGYARLDDRARVMGAGFQAHVAKPIAPAALVSVVADALAATE